MQLKRLKMLLCLASILLCAQGLFAGVISPDPGTSVPTLVPSTKVFTILPGTFLSSNVFAPSGDGFGGTLRIAVATEGSGGNGYCATCLDFLYQFSPLAPVNDALSSLFGEFFPAGLGSIDTEISRSNSAGVGLSLFATPTTGATACFGGTCDPTNSTWNNAGVVTFNFGNNVSVGQTTDILIIRTNVTTYTTGFVGVQNGGNFTVAGWAPAPEPTFVGLLLSGLFGVGLFVARRFQVPQN